MDVAAKEHWILSCLVVVFSSSFFLGQMARPLHTVPRRRWHGGGAACWSSHTIQCWPLETLNRSRLLPVVSKEGSSPLRSQNFNVGHIPPPCAGRYVGRRRAGACYTDDAETLLAPSCRRATWHHRFFYLFMSLWCGTGRRCRLRWVSRRRAHRGIRDGGTPLPADQQRTPPGSLAASPPGLAPVPPPWHTPEVTPIISAPSATPDPFCLSWHHIISWKFGQLLPLPAGGVPHCTNKYFWRGGATQVLPLIRKEP